MFTGYRRHELVYSKPSNNNAIVKKFDDKSDAYTDIEHENDGRSARPGKCWVCGQADERTQNPKLKVLCWEDIDLWIIRDPDGNGGRDHLAIQILLRWHKGENKKLVSTWYIFVEEKLPALCPVANILAKALAEGVIANEEYQDKVKPFFNTKLNQKAVRVRWKPE
ncbi:uncharacterized protein ColSpa_03186 [Colletotrichum spaethianum]|uniref:Uncharacterized protein n=1 Tax=Colletotrichum spaethianum TaxID=700344 RepID=A0AA37LAH0_9PEZI|nr:uncharacterized protein ColSpa_03186 [Colletotrichum spaethianum]GKT43005.1 hypothetical protein ColSpa_03186 [Colletotrichum spaethianum]